MTDSVAGLVLAAGAGTRMRPLTDLRPKPLLPLGASTLVDHSIGRVRSVTDRIAVNVHHAREQMEAALAGVVHLSMEEIPGLGTAGGVAHAAGWVGGDHLLVVNGDTWCPGDLAPVVDSWDRERVRVVVTGPPQLGPGSRIVASLVPNRRLADLAVEPTGLYEVLWAPEAAAGRLDVVGWDGPLIDCATARDYLAANLAESGGESVIGAGAAVDGSVTRSVVWPGGRVWAGEVLVDAVRTDDRVTVLIR
jgi:N-acetyl-alpha-D-muramate 1-phosphate uridylyltransferase